MTASSPGENTGPVPSYERGRRAGLTARFLRAISSEVGIGSLTPAALAGAAASVLPVDGAGLSTLSTVLRVPLGSSTAAVATAEELQTTLGEGPCLDAAEAQASVVLDADDLAARWPLYTEEITRKTPYRSVAAVALKAPGGGVFAALDVYSRNPRISDLLDLAEIDEHVAAPAAALLSTCLAQVPGAEVPEAPPEWYRTAAGRRHDVWVAIGMVMAGRAGRASDALSLLRAHAYTEDATLDDVAADVVHGRLPTTDLTS